MTLKGLAPQYGYTAPPEAALPPVNPPANRDDGIIHSDRDRRDLTLDGRSSYVPLTLAIHVDL